MTTHLNTLLEEDGFITFPDYEFYPSGYAKNQWEQNKARPFHFDLIAVSGDHTQVYCIFNVSDDDVFHGEREDFFENAKYRRFILAAIWTELKTCGLARGHTRFKIGINWTGVDESQKEKWRAFCLSRDYLFWQEKFIFIEVKAA